MYMTPSSLSEATTQVSLVNHTLHMLPHSSSMVITHFTGAFNKGRSCSIPRNDSIRQITMSLVPHNITIKPVYVTSCDNQADPVSHGILGSLAHRLPSISSTQKSSMHFCCMYSTNNAGVHPCAWATVPGGTQIFKPPSLPPPSTRQKHPRLTCNPVDRPLSCPLHLKVLAADCFHLWLTPYGIDQAKLDSIEFPNDILAKRRTILSHAVKPTTLSNYAAGLIRFTKFCNNYAIPERDRMPASKKLLVTFVTTRGAGSVGGGTINSWISGIKLWHQINFAPWHGGEILKRAIESASHSAPKSSCLAKRDPVTLQHTQALYDHLDLSVAFDAAILAIASIAFLSCCCLGELLIDTDFNPKYHVSRSVVIKRSIAADGLSYCTFHIPSSKTKGSHGADIIVTDSTCKCSPVITLNHHLTANIKVPPHAPLFAFEMADGGWAPMRCAWFMSRCNDIWKKQNLGLSLLLNLHTSHSQNQAPRKDTVLE